MRPERFCVSPMFLKTDRQRPGEISSRMIHVVIVVRPVKYADRPDETWYRVAVIRTKDTPLFGEQKRKQKVIGAFSNEPRFASACVRKRDIVQKRKSVSRFVVSEAS